MAKPKQYQVQDLSTDLGTIYTQANTSYAQANTAYAQANAAYTAANNASGGFAKVFFGL
jgi:hypothetical protein